MPDAPRPRLLLLTEDGLDPDAAEYIQAHFEEWLLAGALLALTGRGTLYQVIDGVLTPLPASIPAPE